MGSVWGRGKEGGGEVEGVRSGGMSVIVDVVDVRGEVVLEEGGEGKGEGKREGARGSDLLV